MTEFISVHPVPVPQTAVPDLEAELAAAREDLLAGERALAEEQAAVNAFRMHCRLTIGPWVDQLLDLRSEKQALLTRQRLLRQKLGLPDVETPEPENTADDYEPLPAPAEELVAQIARDRDAEKRLYRELARRFHPDMAANAVERAYCTTIMTAVNLAYEQGDMQTLRDLAGEHDPTAVRVLKEENNVQARRLRQQLMACQRRQRKVARQLQALRAEYTAQLWQRARRLNTTEDQHWWDEIQQVLTTEIGRLRVEVGALQETVGLLEREAAEREIEIGDCRPYDR